LPQLAPSPSASPPVPATTTALQPLQLQTAQAGVVSPKAEPATRVQPRTPIADAPVATIDGQAQAVVVASPAAFSQSTGQDSEPTSDDEPSSTLTPIEKDRAATPSDAPAQAFANVAASAASQPIGPASDVQPAHVASQIAHQADLYRMPGGRGVRIELHPDDLGGVGVTIKYSPTGGLELHIVAEQATTAQLVQSGWNDLRTALAQQGIAPERLIMSVSGPSESNSSSSGPGGQAAFGQAGQSNHQQHERTTAQANRGWAGFGDAPINVTEDVRQSGAVSSSRIDYRV
jgi:flagellar hook-length control protein FliK